jgi:hypothetical protein
MTHKLKLLAGALAIAAFGASASAQTPDTRIVVVGAINNPAHVQPVTDGRDNSVLDMPVVYESQAQNAPAQAQPASAQTRDTHQAPAASTNGANLGQAVKSQ